MTRAFSNALATVQEIDVANSERHNLESNHRKTRNFLSKHYFEQKAAADAKNKDYLDMLSNTEARQQYFKNIAYVKDGDNEEIKRVKNKINQLIKYEIEFAGLKD